MQIHGVAHRQQVTEFLDAGRELLSQVVCVEVTDRNSTNVDAAGGVTFFKDLPIDFKMAPVGGGLEVQNSCDSHRLQYSNILQSFRTRANVKVPVDLGEIHEDSAMTAPKSSPMTNKHRLSEVLTIRYLIQDERPDLRSRDAR